MKHLCSGFLLFLPILAFHSINTSVSGEVAYKLEQGNLEARNNNKKLTNPTSYAHSPIDLFHLAALEEHFYHVVKKYAKKLSAEKPRFIKRYIADYEESSLKAYTSVKTEKERNSGRTKIYSHPFLKHRMIWRFAKYFHKIHAVIKASKNLELKAKTKKVFHEGFQCPNKNDLKQSKQSLTAIHDVYDIKIKDFASGNFSSLLTNITLSALHCHEMAIFAFKEKKYIFAIDWIVTADAMNQAPDRHPILDKINEKALLKLLNAVIAEHDGKWIPTPSPKTNEELYFYQNKIDTEIVLVPQKSVYKKNFAKKGFGQENDFFSEGAAFSNLCQGKNLQLQGTLGEENYIKIIGDRLATFMIYLNDVDRGGNTVFTSAGVSVTPLKGSALFWYNTKRNGEIDFRSWHGGCPVVLGTKWVANKWIHLNLNMFTRRCSLNKDE